MLHRRRGVGGYGDYAPAVNDPPTGGPGARASVSTTTGSRAGDRLLAHKERILSRWEARLRAEIPAAAREPSLILINTLPEILDQLAESFSARHPRRSVTQVNTFSSEHGGERVRLTHFRLEDLIGEYTLLREVLFEVLEEEGPLAVEERNLLVSSLDQAMMEACAGYSLVQSSVRDQLFATIAHDLRSPLSAAQTSAHLIMRQPTAEHVPRWAALIVDNIGRMDRMLVDALDAMRARTGARPPLELAEHDLVEITRRALEPLRAEHGDRLVLDAPEPVRGYFAPDALRRAVENLVTNAVRYGDGSRPVTVTVTHAHERARVKVHNYGTYIPVEQQETLFRAFHRSTAAETSGHRGWGLGLAQARGVAEAHGGSIAVDSMPETGTTFTISIPADARPFQWTPITEPAAVASERDAEREPT